MTPARYAEGAGRRIDLGPAGIEALGEPGRESGWADLAALYLVDPEAYWARVLGED